MHAWHISSSQSSGVTLHVGASNCKYEPTLEKRRAEVPASLAQLIEFGFRRERVESCDRKHELAKENEDALGRARPLYIELE